MSDLDTSGLGRALDHLPLPTWVWVSVEEGDFRLAAFNRAALSLAGPHLRDMVGRLVSEICPPDSPVPDDLRACLQGGGPRQREFSPRSALFPPGGRYRLLYSRPLEDVVLVHAEPLPVEAAGDLVEPVSFLHRLLGNLPGMAYRCRNDEAWTMEFVSPGCEAITGYPPAALVENRQVTFASLIHPQDQAMVWHMVQAGLEDRGRFDVAYRIVRPDGSVRWVWEQGTGVATAPDGETVTILEGFITDITDRHELAVELRASERRFQSLMEQSLAGVYLISRGRFTYANERFAEIFGRSVDEVRALDSILELVHPDDREQVRENLRRQESGETERVQEVFRGLRGDGAVIHVEAHGSVVREQGDPVILGILMDVTERTRASERYHQAQKMEALGRLAGGIAHDFNNVLSVIRTLADLLELEVGTEATLVEDLTEIKRAAERGASLSRQLMAFSKPDPDQLELLSLSDAVLDLIPMLERILGADVVLVTEVDPALPAVEADPSHMEQVLMNLVINARDAMPDGGTLTLRTGLGVAPAGRSGEHVFLSVTDTGTGIPEPIRRRIFEPFFTTKGAQGTGLGLGNVWTIIDRYGGTVDVISELGEGSTFTIHLPVKHSEE